MWSKSRDTVQTRESRRGNVSTRKRGGRGRRKNIEGGNGVAEKIRGSQGIPVVGLGGMESGAASARWRWILH